MFAIIFCSSSVAEPLLCPVWIKALFPYVDKYILLAGVPILSNVSQTSPPATCPYTWLVGIFSFVPIFPIGHGYSVNTPDLCIVTSLLGAQFKSEVACIFTYLERVIKFLWFPHPVVIVSCPNIAAPPTFRNLSTALADSAVKSLLPLQSANPKTKISYYLSLFKYLL